MSALNKIENEKASDIALTTLLRLCAFFGVSPDYLLGFDRSELHVRALLDSGKPVHFRLPKDSPDIAAAKCAECDHLLIPGVPHTISECMLFMRELGRSARFIAMRFGFTPAVVEVILREQLRLLRLNTHHHPTA